MRTILLLGTLAAAAAANAVTFDSFYNVAFHGVTVSHSGTDYSTEVSSGAYLTYNGSNYTIVNGFGFFALGKGIDLTPAFSGSTQFGNWDYLESNSGSGGSIAGFMDASKKEPLLTPGGGGLIFHYTTADASLISSYGFHFTLDRPLAGSGTDGKTFYVTGPMVPEPATYAVLGIGLLGLVRRRKNR